MPPRNWPKKTMTLSLEATQALTDRTWLLIERVEKTLAKILLSLHKEKNDLQEFASTHFWQVTSQKAPSEELTKPASSRNKWKKKIK